MTTIAKWIISIVILAGLAAVAVALLSQPKPQREGLMALYHLSKDGGTPVDYDNLAALKAQLFYPVDAFAYIRWEVVYDGYEQPHKVIPGWDVEVGKDSGGLYHRNPFDTEPRTTESSPESIKAWLSSL